MIKVQFIIKDKSDLFYEKLESMDVEDAYKYLDKESRGSYKMHGLSQKEMQFRDKVDLNSLLRGAHKIVYKREIRKGYYLITFEFTKN